MRDAMPPCILVAPPSNVQCDARALCCSSGDGRGGEGAVQRDRGAQENQGTAGVVGLAIPGTGVLSQGWCSGQQQPHTGVAGTSLCHRAQCDMPCYPQGWCSKPGGKIVHERVGKCECSQLCKSSRLHGRMAFEDLQPYANVQELGPGTSPVQEQQVSDFETHSRKHIYTAGWNDNKALSIRGIATGEERCWGWDRCSKSNDPPLKTPAAQAAFAHGEFVCHLKHTSCC